MNTSRSNQRTGFTVLELLIVTVIISILAAILVPVLKGAKERAKAVKCGGNLRALYTLWQIKRSDDAKLQSTSSFGSAIFPRVSDAEWPAAYLPYAMVGGIAIDTFVCPSDTNVFQSPLALIDEYSVSSGVTNRIARWAVEEPVFDYAWPVPNPRTVCRKSGNGNESSPCWHKLQITQNSNQTATISVVAGSTGTKLRLYDQTGTNLLHANFVAGASVTVPTMAVSYGYNYIDLMSVTNLPGQYSCYGGTPPPYRVKGYPDEATRAVLLIDYPVSHVRCAICYFWPSTGTGICAPCGTNTASPGFADKWEANAMGPQIGRHQGKCNVLFQDGSLSLRKPAEIDPRFNLWQVKQTGSVIITNRLWRTGFQDW